MLFWFARPQNIKNNYLMRRCAIILLMIVFSGVLPLRAQHLAAHRGDVRDGYDFWLYRPPADSCPEWGDSVAVRTGCRKPLILFLHGRSLCGSNLDKVRRYGPLNALEMGMKIDAYVVAPQARGSWDAQRLMRVVDWVCSRYPIDTLRLYVIGMSMGGYGTLDLVGSYPERFAAAMALCGGSTLKDMCSLNQLPLWILHGTADRAVPVLASQRVVDAMGECDSTSRLIWTPLKGASHGGLARIFYLEKTYRWLFAHSLDDSARVVCRDVDIDLDDMKRDVYRAVREGGGVVIREKEEPRVSEVGGKAGDGGDIHTVRRGDTLSSIARRYGTTVAALCRLNGMAATATLRIGCRLRVR